MQTQYVYHAVTERPMEPGQKIIFDETHPNGVYRRVRAFQNLIQGAEAPPELAALINSDPDRWAKVAYRELALEKVRLEQFPGCPSRLACLYTSRSLEEAKNWAQFFKEIGRTVYSIVRLKVNGAVFDADACNCFDGTENEADNLEKARHYWMRDIQNDTPVIETLVDGEITVDQIIEEFIHGPGKRSGSFAR